MGETVTIQKNWQELIRPNKLQVTPGTDPNRFATLVAEPPSDGPRFSYRLGNRDPLDRGAGGVAALAAGPPQPGEPDRVATARAQGFITTHGELNAGAHAIAAPLPQVGRPASAGHKKIGE